MLIFLSALFSGLETALFSLKSPSAAAARGKSSVADQVHSALPRQSAPGSERPPARRRAGQRAAGRPLSCFSSGAARWQPNSAMAGRDRDFRDRRAPLRSDPETARALGALPALHARRFHPSSIDAIARSRRQLLEDASTAIVDRLTPRVCEPAAASATRNSRRWSRWAKRKARCRKPKAR